MTISNVGIDSVLSDPFGKTENEIISYLNKRENGKQEAEGDNLLEH